MAVLLLDRNTDRCNHIREALTGTPLALDLKSFQKPEAALKWAKGQSIDLLLVDQDLADEMHVLAKRCPVLILRNTGTRDNVPLWPGVSDSIGQDFSPQTLLSRIQNLLKLHRGSGLNLDDHRETNTDDDRYHLAFSGTNDGVWDWSREDDSIYFSKRWLDMIGYRHSDGDMDTAFWFSRVHPEDVSMLDTAITAHTEGALERLHCEYRLRHKNGHYIWVLTRGQVVRDKHGKMTRLVGTQTDISDRKMAEQKIAFNALHDPLTGLANRALLMERLDQIIIQHARDPSQQFGILFIDLDHFKDVNDSMGHEAGDEVLKQVAERLQSCCRASDTLARLGGDEFVLLAVGSDAEKDVIHLAQRILDELDRPFEVHEKEVIIGASIGVVCDTQDYTIPEKAVRDADLALYQAKSTGRRCYKIFNASMDMPVSKHFALQTTLTGALDRGELLMMYQPIVDFKTMQVKGFESLMRWHHPENGHIFPADFIPVAEETGLIDKMGMWALNTTTKQMAEWKKQLPHAKDWQVSVNVSARQLENDHFVAQVAKALDDSGLDPGALILEMTETVLMNKMNIIMPTILSLKKLGVKMAIDDFGTGYSSLVVLNDYPFDIIKVPRDFICDIDQRPKAANTVRLIRLLAKETRMKTVFEGMETKDEVNAIKPLKPDMVQGFYYSKPLKSAAVVATFKSDAVIHKNQETKAS